MSEDARILARLEQARRDGEEMVVATVVKVEGSAYRRPGARMLVTREGERIGSVSGGCLEDDVVKKAWWLTENGRNALRRYDTRTGDGVPGAFGVGCNGVVHVLFERIAAADGEPLRELLREVHGGRHGAVIACVISGAAAVVGTRLALYPDGSMIGTLGDDTLDTQLFHDLLALKQKRRSQLRTYHTPQGDTELFLEYLTPPQRLVVFGAGHDAEPLVRLAHELGWRITVADERPHYARAERFPHAGTVLTVDADDAIAATGIDDDSAVVVMTHNYDQDRRLLAQLLRHPPRYVGQLGPRSRTEAMLDELAAAGPPLQRQTLHYPAGLDIGGRDPAQIALSIIAEIQAVLAGRDGAMLLRRDAPIHGATESDARSIDLREAVRR